MKDYLEISILFFIFLSLVNHFLYVRKIVLDIYRNIRQF